METLKVILYIVTIVLIVALILLSIKAIGTLAKFDFLVENLTRKAESLDSVFEMIERTTSRFGAIGDAITSSMMNVVRKIFTKKEKRKGEIK